MKSELYILFLFLNFVRFLNGINFNIPIILSVLSIKGM